MLDKAHMHSEAANARASVVSRAGAPHAMGVAPPAIANRFSYLPPVTVEHLFQPGADTARGSGAWHGGEGEASRQIASLQEQLEALGHEVLRWKSAAQVGALKRLPALDARAACAPSWPC
jgi:hypothetical protein